MEATRRHAAADTGGMKAMLPRVIRTTMWPLAEDDSVRKEKRPVRRDRASTGVDTGGDTTDF